MADLLSADDHQAALDDLAQQLSAALSGTELVELPPTVWKPFKRPTEPDSRVSLRGLSQLFTGRNATNVLKLSPMTFVRLVSALLYSPTSAAPHRLLCSLIAALKTWTDIEAILAALQSKKIRALEMPAIIKHNATLRSELAKAVLRILGSFSVGDDAKHCAAQMLAIVTWKGPESDDLALSPADSLRLGQLITNAHDYVLRILVADAMRQLVSNGEDLKSFWDKDTAQFVLDGFPVADEATPLWLLKIQDLLSEMDKDIAFRGIHYSVFRVKNCTHWKDDETIEEGEPVAEFLVAISTHISCIIPTARQGLDLVVYPIIDKASMSVTNEANTEGVMTTLKIEYSNDVGHRVVSGNKEVVRGLKFDFDSTEQATKAADAVLSLQQQQEARSEADHSQQVAQSHSQAASRRRSIAIIDLSSSPRGLLDTGPSEDSTHQSDTYPISPSPLDKNADQSLTGMRLERMADDVERPVVPTPAVTRRSKSFHEKIRAASTKPTKDISQPPTDPESSRSASHGFEGLQNIEDIDSGSSKLAAKKHRSSTLGKANAVQPQQPLERQTRSSESMEKAPKDDRQDDTAQNVQNGSKSAQEPSSRTKKPQRKVVSTDRGDSRKQNQPAKGVSNAATVEDSQLKRLKRPKSQATGSKKTVDWDADIRDVEEYDLPSDDEPQSKKPKLSGKKTSGKATNDKESKNGASQPFKKPLPPTKASSRAPKSGPAKRNKAAPPVKPAPAPRRSQRVTKTLAYDEPEASDKHTSSDVQESSDKENEPSDQQQEKKKTASRTGIAKTRAALQPSLDDDRSQTATSDKLGGNAHHPIEFSDDSDLGVARRPKPSALGDRGGEAADTETAQAPTDAQHEDEFAEDSYPMSKEQAEAAAPLSKESFADRLLGFAKSPSVGTKTARPDTPFGDKTKFVSSVNASRSARSERDARKVASKHSRVSPTEKSPNKKSASNSSSDEHSVTLDQRELGLGEKAAAGTSETIKQTRYAPSRTERGTRSMGAQPAYEDDPPLEDATSGDRSSQMEVVVEEQGTRGQSKGAVPKEAAVGNSRAPEAVETPGMSKSTALNLTVETGDEKHTATAETDDGPLSRERRVSEVPIVVPRSPSEAGNRKPARPATLGRLEKVPKQAIKTSAQHKTPAQNQARKPEVGTQARATGKTWPTTEEAGRRSSIIGFTPKGPANQGRSPAGLALKRGAVSGHKTRNDILEWSAGTESPVPDEAVIPAGTSRRDRTSPQGQQHRDLAEPQDAHNADDGPHQDWASEHNSHASATSNDDEGLRAQETGPEHPGTHVEAPSELRGPSPQPEVEDDGKDAGSASSSSEQHSAEPSIHSSNANKSDSAPSDVGAGEDNTSDRGDDTSQSLQQHTEQLGIVFDRAPRVDEHAVDVIVPSKKPAQQNTSTNKMTPRASHDPLGIRDMLDSTFPDSQQKIETGASRKERGKDRLAEPISSTTSMNPLAASATINRDQTEAPETSAEVSKRADRSPHVSRTARDRSMMPPPPRKAPATAVPIKPTAWPDVQPSEKPAKPAKQHSIGSRTSTGPGTTNYKPAAARSSRLPIAAANSRSITQNPSIASAGTPEPFHAVLAVQAKRAKHAQHPQESPAESEAYSTDANDRTLVNEEDDDNCGNQTEYTMPLYDKNFESVKAYDEYSSVAEEDDQASKVDVADEAAWATGLKPTHTDLLGLVMQMTRDVLFHLGAEEDAIAAKQIEFKQGAEQIAEDIQKSWTHRLHHEAEGLASSLSARRASMSRDVGQHSEVRIPSEAELQKVSERWQKKDTTLKDQLDQLSQLL